MVSYTQNELLSITDFTKSISKILGDIKELEELMNSIEHKDIYNIVQNRINTSKSDYISMEDMAKKFNIDTSSL